MKKSEVIDSVAAAAGVTKAQAEAAIDAFFETVVTSVSGDDAVAWPGFGTFSLSSRAARIGRNPQTGEALKIAASKGMKFASSTGLKAALNPAKTAKKPASKKG